MAFLSLRLTFHGLTRTAAFHSIMTGVNTFSTQASTQISTPLVLKFSQFAHLLEGPTEAIYRGTPLASLSQNVQGKLCQAWARRVLQEQNPESEILDPEPGTDCNGNSRSLNRAPLTF